MAFLRTPLPSIFSEVHKAMVARRDAQCADVVDPDDGDRLTTKQAAEFLGISRATLIRLQNKGELRYYQVAGRNQFPVRDLRAYLASCEHGAVNA